MGAEDKFINLANHELTRDQKQDLNFELNCHIQGKLDLTTKKMKLVLPYRAACKLENEKKMIINEGFSIALKNGGNRNRSTQRNSILTQNPKNAINELKRNENIVIRRAYKSSNYVILDGDYCRKRLDCLLNDTTKLERIRSNLSKELKIKLN